MSRTSTGFNLPPNVHFLRRDWFNSNSLLITGTPTVLVDCGSDIGAAGLLGLLANYGVAPEGVDLIVATHSHADHVGGIAELQHRCGTRVAMHEYDAHYVNKDDHWATWRTPNGNCFPPFRVDLTLHDGDVLELEGLSLHVLHTPGHAYGGISLHCPEHRFLISGDAVWEKAVGLINVRVEGSIAPFLACESVRRLMALDVAVVLPGHGRAIPNAAENFRDALAYVEAFLDDPRRMAYDLVWRVAYFNLWRWGALPVDEFRSRLSSLAFFAETNQLFFRTTDEALFQRVLDDLQDRRLITVEADTVDVLRQP